MSTSTFLLGSATWGYVPIRVKAPVDGSATEKIANQSVSLAGVTTSNLRAVKRRYTWPLCIVDSAGYADLDAMFRQPGPWWLHDSTMPSTTPVSRRLMHDWIVGSNRINPDASGNVTLTAGAAVATWENTTTPKLSGLLPVVPGQTVVFGVDAWAASGAPLLQVGWRFCDASGGSATASSTNWSLSTTRKRVGFGSTVPAGKSYAQPTLQTTSSGVTVTGPSTGAAADPGSPWRVVLFEALTPLSHTPTMHSLSIALREV